MNRPVIVIVSVLKPLDDTRMYEKLGLSLGESNKYEVNIIGFTANKPEYAPNINFLPLPFFRRLSLRRFFMPWYVLRHLRRLRPDLVVSSGPDLIPALAWYCKRTGCRWIRDVRENYRLNLRSQRHYSPLTRRLLSGLVSGLERWSARYVTHFLLAERIYAEQLSWLDGRFTILENKFKGQIPDEPPVRGHKKLLFTGTLGKHTGVDKALETVRLLHTADPSVTLDILGYAPDAGFRTKLRNKVKEYSFVHLNTGEKPLPHSVILEAVRHADAGIIWYADHPSTRGKIPTKLFEYMALQLPVFMEPREEWLALTDPFQAALALTSSGHTLLRQWQAHTFYTRIPGREVCWENESTQWKNVVKSAL